MKIFKRFNKENLSIYKMLIYIHIHRNIQITLEINSKSKKQMQKFVYKNINYNSYFRIEFCIKQR